MVTTYQAMLKAGRLDWGDAGPPRALLALDVPVELTVLSGEWAGSNGEAMAAALARIAETTAAAAYGDPSQWQRETRQDRILEGRIE